MNHILKITLALAFALVFGINVNAQVKAGDIISGTVVDEESEPLISVIVQEVDANGRSRGSAITDFDGNFSFRCADPKDKLSISYVGFQEVSIPINKKVFKIVMKSKTVLKTVEVVARAMSKNSGLTIPATEISVAQQHISMKEFEGIGMTSVDEALQGRVAGLDIVQNSGNLGDGTTMRLRGVSTIYGDANPLIVVNGNVWDNDSKKDFDFTNANQERFAELLNVNPEDIEDIVVLKDASATAMWGAQGANGVIEIRTKRGARGKTLLQYSFNLTATWMPEGMKLLNGDDYTMYMKESLFNPQLSSAFSTKGNSLYIPEINYDKQFSEYNMYNDNTDWVSAIQQTGIYQQHHFNLSGGGTKANFYISAGYDHQTGTVIQQALDRFTTRVALDYFISSRITATTNFDLTYTKNKRNNTSFGGDLLSIAYQKMPNLSIYEEDEYGNDLDYYYIMNPYIDYPVRAGRQQQIGQQNYPLLQDQYDKAHPLAVADYARSEERTVNLSPEFILKYKLLGVDSDSKFRLDYEGQVQFQIYNNNNDAFLPGTVLSKNWRDENYNSATAGASKNHSINTRHKLTFAPNLGDAHSLSGLAQFEYKTGNSSSQNVGRNWIPTSSISSAYVDSHLKSMSTGAGQWKSANMLFQMHYSYKGRYSFTGSIRGDGSTKFGPERRWGYFPGLSARWNISDEPWMEKIKWLDMLSIKPGWGIAGTSPNQEGLYFSKYAAGKAYMSDGSIAPSNISLSSLRWEKKETWNLGFDIALFNHMLTGDINLYSQTTKDLLMPNVNIPTSSGYSTLSNANVGTMRNNGWEFNLNGNRVVKIGKDFSMDFNVSFANNRNEILEMESTVIENLNGEFKATEGNAKYLSRVQLNNPLGAIYGFRYLGTYQYSEYSEVEVPGVTGPDAPVAKTAEGAPILNSSGNPKQMYYDFGGEEYPFVGGDAKYEDINHDGQINELDIVYLGSSLPTVTGGFGLKFHYKNWNLNAQFNYRLGQKVINAARMNAEAMDNANNQSRAINWRWHNEGDITEMPRACNATGSGANFKTYNYLGSDRFMEDASFVRLNYVNLSYDFDKELIKNLGLANLKLTMTLNNLFVLTKYSGVDPEIAQAGYSPATDNARTPRSRSVKFGLIATFK